MILLDTHVLIWLAEDQPLSQPALDAISAGVERHEALVSAVTAMELAMLSRRRLRFSSPLPIWFADATERLGLRVISLDAEVALASAELPDWRHGDPMDRLLVATARSLNVPIVTRDREILASAAAGHVRAVAC